MEGVAPSAPRKMKDKPPYRAWVGVLFGLLLNGSAHFLSGARAAGVKWFLSILACSTLPLAFMAVPGTASYVAGVLLWFVGFVLWCVMLKQSCRPVPRIRFLGWMSIICVSLCLAYGWECGVRALVQPFSLPTAAMSPTLLPGDYLLVEKVTFWFADPKRGDIVVFKTKGIEALPQNSSYLKRVVGLPGDLVRIDPPNLIVNGQIVSDPPIFRRIAAAAPPFAGFQLASGNVGRLGVLKQTNDELVLKQDEYFVLGDNTRNSFDSRYWGAVPRKNIIGRATRIYWPFNRIGQSLGAE